MIPKLQSRRQGDLPHSRGSHPEQLVNELRQYAIASGKTFESICDAAGVARPFFRVNNIPTLPRLRAVGEVLGYELKWVKK